MAARTGHCRPLEKSAKLKTAGMVNSSSEMERNVFRSDIIFFSFSSEHGSRWGFGQDCQQQLLLSINHVPASELAHIPWIRVSKENTQSLIHSLASRVGNKTSPPSQFVMELCTRLFDKMNITRRSKLLRFCEAKLLLWAW